jgi:hypothetical protein
VNKIAFHNLILTKYFPKVKIKGSSFMSPALGGAGQGEGYSAARLQKIFGEAKRGRGGEEKGFGEKEFPPRPSVIFKIQRQDFRGKRFGFYSRQTAKFDGTNLRF